MPDTRSKTTKTNMGEEGSHTHEFIDDLKHRLDAIVVEMGTLQDLKSALDSQAKIIDEMRKEPSGAAQAQTHLTNSPAPSIFSGETECNAVSWIGRYVSYCDHHDIKPAKRLSGIPLYLSGIAYDWWRNLEQTKRNTFENFQKAFVERFTVQPPDWMRDRKLLDMRQSPSQSINAFAREILLEAEISNIKDQTKIHSTFCWGLLPKYKQAILQKDTKTLEEAIQVCMKVDLANSIREPRENLTAQTGISFDSVMTKMQSEITDLKRELIRSSAPTKPDTRVEQMREEIDSLRQQLSHATTRHASESRESDLAGIVHQLIADKNKTPHKSRESYDFKRNPRPYNNHFNRDCPRDNQRERFNSDQPKFGLYCTACRRKGHNLDQCWNKRSGKFCDFCKRYGHLAEQCYGKEQAQRRANSDRRGHLN